MKHKIGIIDDHVLFADGIGNLLSGNPEYDICFTGKNSVELFQFLKTSKVDILLLDINLPGDNGLDILATIKESHPAIKVMILTTHQPDDIGIHLNTFKGDAYVLKISGKHILEMAFKHLIENKQFFDPNIFHHPLNAEKRGPSLNITKREKEIISLIAQGKSTKEIAELLSLSEMTIKTHRKNISEKIGSKGKGDLIYKAINIKY